MKIREVNILEHVLKNDTGVSVPHNLWDKLDIQKYYRNNVAEKAYT